MNRNSVAQKQEDEQILDFVRQFSKAVRPGQGRTDENRDNDDTTIRRRRTKPIQRENKDLRECKSQLYRPSVEVLKTFRLFARNEILPDVTITRIKRLEKEDTLIGILYQLIRCSLNDWAVADSRNTAEAEIRSRVQLWDALENAGFVRKCLGSETSGKVTRYAATQKLLSLRKFWRQSLFCNTRLRRNSRLIKPTRQAPVVIQSKDRSESGRSLRVALPFSDFPSEAPMLVDFEDRIEALNAKNGLHTWLLKSDFGGLSEVDFQLRQIHIDRPWNGTRFYTGGRYSIQNQPKTTRRRILIDDQPTTEPDFSGSHPRLLYHMFAKQQGPENMQGDDIYLVDLVFPALQLNLSVEIPREDLRKAVKLATNICINSSTRAMAHGAVFKMLISENLLDLMSEWLGQSSDLAAELVRSILKAHPLVEQYFFQRRGLELMTIESQIMLEILERVTATDRPALGIHDSVLCRQQDEEFVRGIMASAYRKRTGFDPVVR